MFPIKILGACFLTVAGWYGGVAFCEKITLHRMTLGEIISLLKKLDEEISFRRAHLQGLYTMLCVDSAFSHLFGTKENLKHHSFQEMCPPHCLNKEETAMFLSCFSRIGYTGAMQECERLSRYCAQFEQFYTRAQTVEQQALAIDRKIGIAIGGMLALVLL